MQTVDREKALEVLYRYNESESLRAHALAVEAVMRYIAARWGEDEEYWGAVGLLHDVDYEKYPEQHCRKAPELLAGAGFDEELIRSVVSHGWGICSEVAPQHRMEKALYAVDELCGLVTAAVYMRPSRSVLDLEVSSLKKKFKSKSFAAGVNREVIQKGAEMLGLELAEVMELVIRGMQARAQELGLAGNPA